MFCAQVPFNDDWPMLTCVILYFALVSLALQTTP